MQTNISFHDHVPTGVPTGVTCLCLLLLVVCVCVLLVDGVYVVVIVRVLNCLCYGRFDNMLETYLIRLQKNIRTVMLSSHFMVLKHILRQYK